MPVTRRLHMCPQRTLWTLFSALLVTSLVVGGGTTACDDGPTDPSGSGPTGSDVAADAADTGALPGDGGRREAGTGTDAGGTDGGETIPPSDAGPDTGSPTLLPDPMEVGEVREFLANDDDTISLTLPTPEGGESYLAVLFSAAWSVGEELYYDLQVAPWGGDSDTLTAGTPPPAPREEAGAAGRMPPNFAFRAEAHRPFPRLPGPRMTASGERDGGRVRAGARAGSGAAAAGAPSAFFHHSFGRWPHPAAAANRRPSLAAREPVPRPEVGDHRMFQVADADFARVLEVDAECVRVGGSLAVWLDRTTEEPEPAGVEPDQLDPIVAGFEETVLPRHRIFFGQEPDVDGDGLIHLLFTPIFAETGIVAYVSPCDLVDLAGCPVYNGMELVYVTPPNLLGAVMGSVSSVLETLAHETQHTIYFARKFLRNDQVEREENPYVTEALSALAEDLSGYGNGTFYVWSFALEAIGDVSGPDLLDSDVDAYDPRRDGALRGAGYLLYRFLYDQAGGNTFGPGNAITDAGGVAFLRSLVDSAEVGPDNLEAVTGRPVADLLFDWYTALLLTNRRRDDGTPLHREGRFSYLPTTTDPDTRSSGGRPERHGVDPYAENPMTGEALEGPPVVASTRADGVIRAGGVEYLRIRGRRGFPAVRVTVLGDRGSELRLRLIRER